MKIIFAVLLLTLISFAACNVIKVFNSIEDFKAKNPEVKLIELEAVDHDLTDSRSYTLGARQTGDIVVANASDKKTWPISQNVTTTLTYPSSGGYGAFLTFILINCDQSSNLGRAYVTQGGIGQHFIQIIVEARITTFFNYAAFFYGIK